MGRIEVKPERPERSLAGLALVAGALLAVAALVALTHGPAETEDPSVRSRLNSRGQVTQLSGPDPRSVLEAYCRSESPDTQRVALRVTASGDTWTGFYRQQGTVYAISIRENPRTRQWVVGNAVDPVLPTQTSLQPKRTIPSR